MGRQDRIIVTSTELQSIRSAVYEAGHAAVCLHFGGRLSEVTLRSRPQSRSDSLANFPDASERNISQLAREQIVIGFAGAAAQRMFYPDQPEAEIVLSARTDFEYVQSIVNNGRYGTGETYIQGG
jgi:hypothetical protein